MSARSILVAVILLMMIGGHESFALAPADPKAGRIEGRVLKFPNVEPLAEVRVQAMELYAGDSGRRFAEARVDADGRFVFDGVPSGSVRLQPVFQVGSDGRSVTLPGALLLPALVSGGETTEITLFGKGRPIRGMLVLPAEVKPENVSVELQFVAPPWRLVAGRDGRPTHGPGWSIYSVLTATKLVARLDAAGRFRIEGVREGNYRLSARLVAGDRPLVFRCVVERGYPGLEHGKMTVSFIVGGESSEPLNLGSLEFGDS